MSRTIEKELASIELLRRVTSVSKDDVSSVLVEFEYPKGLEAAATERRWPARPRYAWSPSSPPGRSAP